ncbi:MAG: glycosyl hydrolase family 15 [Synechococcales cyanobacterium RM1_1_8]|nr:glycosyl hydrolase family 15 [Synechococcales cyanobacterium RM1_1_8]
MASSFPQSPSSSTQRDGAIRQRLDSYYQPIKTVILSRQNPISGLLPASTAITTHGDYTDAWVRDNVYSILAVWGLAIAYRKSDLNPGRTFELEHSVIKLMRGLLFAMMKQAPKVEQFKATQDPRHALHAKYDTRTGDPVVGDDAWGHLQLDATSLFLLMLAEMTASGLSIVFTLDEVSFVQNLVYYIGRTYRTPDYGIWERGNKINHGNPELNASSVGMAKAALEALNGFNLFGIHGGQASVIHVLPDEIARARATLTSLLPRESSSKEVDAATLSVIGFPAFAIEDTALADRTRNEIIAKLQGRYGCKRFLRDGHQTVVEDHQRLHYDPWELQQFEQIECEWPLFYAYLMLDGLFRGDRDFTETYRQRLEFVEVKQGGIALLPELYYVPAAQVEAERANPGSQTRLPNENVPLVWAQSLYYLGQMMADGLLAPGDIDPLGRHSHLGKQRQPTVQIALVAEDELLQGELEACGVATQTVQQLDPVQLYEAQELSKLYQHIGANPPLQLTGRPLRRLRSLTTSRLFRIRGEAVVFLPAFLDREQFYLPLDEPFLVAQIKSEIAYVHRNWRELGKPLITLLITRTMLENGREALLTLMQTLNSGICDGVPVQVGPLQQLMLTAGLERINDLGDFSFTALNTSGSTIREAVLKLNLDHNQPLSNQQEFALEVQTDLESIFEQLRQSSNLYEQIELLQTLRFNQGLDFPMPLGSGDRPICVRDTINEVYDKASQLRLWALVRRAAALLDKVDIGLSDAVTDILVRRKQIAVGRAYSAAALIVQPLSNPELQLKLKEFCREDIRDRVLTQEILLHLGVLIKADPDRIKGFLTLRVGYLILLLTSQIAQEQQLTQDEAYEALMQQSPFAIKMMLLRVLAGYDDLNQVLQQQESLHIVRVTQSIDWVVAQDTLPNGEEAEASTDWLQRRQLEGSLNRVPKDFYKQVWQLLNQCKGVVIGDKLERRNRLDSYPLVLEMTAGETNFALRIEHLLNKIQAPQYRQINIEALLELAAIAHQNPDLKIEDYLVLDVLIGHAVRLAWLADQGEQADPEVDQYSAHKASAWQAFYRRPPLDCAAAIAQAFRYLIESGYRSEADLAAADPLPAEEPAEKSGKAILGTT